MFDQSSQSLAPARVLAWRPWAKLTARVPAGWLRAAVPVSLVFLVMAISYTALTPAWENNDEADHVDYIEYIVNHGTPPHISLTHGIESHQPPLYYYIAAGWQTLLGRSAFTPHLDPPGGPALAPSQRVFEVSHNYSGIQQRDATTAHLLRLTSVFWGLLAVLAAVTTGWLLSKRTAVAAAVGLTVALWPKFIVVMSAITNSSLVIAMCACAIPSFLLWQRRRHPGWAALTGAALGAGALTQETALPLSGLLLLALVVLAWRERDWRSPVAAIGAFLLVCGWWYIRDDIVYGDFLASTASQNYLAHDAGLPGLVRVPPSLAWSVWTFSWKVLSHSLWFDGGWNQLQLPHWLDWCVWVAAGASLIAAIRSRVFDRWLLALCGLAAVIAWVAIIRSTTQAEGRYLLVGVVGWAGLLVAGGATLARGRAIGLWIWPAIMLGLDVYVYATWTIPYG